MSSFWLQLHVIRDVVGVERVFVPVVVELFEHAADPQRLHVIVRPRAVEHEAVARTHGVSNMTADLDVLLPVSRRMNLVSVESGLPDAHGFFGVCLFRWQNFRTCVRGNGVPVAAEHAMDR